MGKMGKIDFWMDDVALWPIKAMDKAVDFVKKNSEVEMAGIGAFIFLLPFMCIGVVFTFGLSVVAVVTIGILAFPLSMALITHRALAKKWRERNVR